MRIALGALLVGCLAVVGCGEQEGQLKKMSAPASASRVSTMGYSYHEARPQMVDSDRTDAPHNTETYDRIVDNGFLTVSQNPLSTFSIDVDTASFSIVRRFLSEHRLPPPGAVRIEEMVNYFTYAYPQPTNGKPFSVNVETAACPWNAEHRLVRIGLKGREITQEQRPPSNLVFLLDVSGSMDDPRKLPMVKSGMQMLVEQLADRDSVAIVTYAGASGIALPPTPATKKARIIEAIYDLQPSGSTNGAQGIELAYQLAEQNRIPGGTNRVILCTDGDFNVGVTSQDELVRLIERNAKGGVFLSVLGFGMGNYKDSTLEKLADMGNGNYAYIDTLREAKKVLIDQMQGTLITIAKDVKIQIEFNPSRAAGYRLIGYENRLLAKEDFNNDSKDAGDIGAGHTVTALYEVVPAGKTVPSPEVDPLKYQAVTAMKPVASGDSVRTELMTVKLRYKQPEAVESQLIEVAVPDQDRQFNQASSDFVWAASVAEFGMILRNSKHRGNATLTSVLEMARPAVGSDLRGYRQEFIELLTSAISLNASAR